MFGQGWIYGRPDPGQKAEKHRIFCVLSDLSSDPTCYLSNMSNIETAPKAAALTETGEFWKLKMPNCWICLKLMNLPGQMGQLSWLVFYKLWCVACKTMRTYLNAIFVASAQVVYLPCLVSQSHHDNCSSLVSSFPFDLSSSSQSSRCVPLSYPVNLLSVEAPSFFSPRQPIITITSIIILIIHNFTVQHNHHQLCHHCYCFPIWKSQTLFCPLCAKVFDFDP